MAYVRPDLQISLNDDKSFTVFINKDCLSSDNDENDEMDDDEIILSAMTVNDLISIIKKYAPMMTQPSDQTYQDLFNEVEVD